MPFTEVQSGILYSRGDFVKRRLIIDGNEIYEIDETCVKKRAVPENTVREVKRKRKRRRKDK